MVMAPIMFNSGIVGRKSLSVIHMKAIRFRTIVLLKLGNAFFVSKSGRRIFSHP